MRVMRKAIINWSNTMIVACYYKLNNFAFTKNVYFVQITLCNNGKGKLHSY